MRQFLSGLVGLLSVIILFVIKANQNWLVFAILAFLWLLILVGAEIYIGKKNPSGFVSIFTVGVTGLSILCLLLLLEQPFLENLIIILAGVVVFLLLAQPRTSSIRFSYEMKPVRRLVVWLLVFDLYALLSFTFGIGQFFPSAPLWLSSLPVAVISGMVAIRIWRMYYSGVASGFVLWAIVLSLTVWEMVNVFAMLPLGYFVSGGLIIWVWYVLHLLVRFHFTPQKIVWRRQSWFLAINFILFLLVLLFFVRWI